MIDKELEVLEAMEILESIKDICKNHNCDDCPFSRCKEECFFETGFWKSPCNWEIKTMQKIIVE